MTSGFVEKDSEAVKGKQEREPVVDQKISDWRELDKDW